MALPFVLSSNNCLGCSCFRVESRTEHADQVRGDSPDDSGVLSDSVLAV
jgi:hypothetical protein